MFPLSPTCNTIFFFNASGFTLSLSGVKSICSSEHFVQEKLKVFICDGVPAEQRPHFISLD